MKEENQKRRRLQLRLLLIFVVFSLIWFVGLKQVQHDHELQQLQRITERYEFAYNTIYDQYKQLSVTLYSGIMERFSVQELYQELLTADARQKKILRKELFSRVRSRYTELQQEVDLRQLHFHLRDNESFLRFHRPEKFGDDLTEIRETVSWVNREHTFIDGFEEGRIYNGYRFVFPITAADRTHLGSVEISFGPNALTSAMMRQYAVLSNFFIKETSVQEKLFLEEQEQNYIQSNHKGYLFDKEVLAEIEKISRNEMTELFPDKQIVAEVYAMAHRGHPVSLYDPDIDAVFTTIPVFTPVSQEMVAFLSVRSQSDFFKHEIMYFRAVYSMGLLVLVMILFIFYQQYIRRLFFEESTKQLQKQQQQLVDAQQIANLGHWELDLLTRQLHWSEQIFTIFELDSRKVSPTINLYMEKVHPDDHEFVSTSFANHVEKHQSYDIQYRLLCQENREKWVRGICTTEYDSSGLPLRSLGIIHDITEQHNTLKILQRERDMFMRGPVMTFTWQNSENWPVEQVSANVFELLGYADREFLDGSLFYASLIYPDDLERVLNEVGSAAEAEKKAFSHKPYRLVKRDGTILWVQDHTTIVRASNGTISHYQAYLIDITEAMGLSAEARESKERLELVINGANLGTWDWNIKSGEVIFNENWTKMLGCKLSEFEPSISAWSKLVHPDEEEEINRILTDHLEGRTPVYMTEHRLKHKSGKWIWVLDVGKVFERDKDGNPIRAVGIHMNISEQKEVEQVLMAARTTAETANKAKSAFLSNMSHELRTPLNAILGYTQIFSADESLTPKQQSGIRTMHQSGEHLLMLINDILDLSKIEADKMELVESEFRLSGFLQGIADIITVRSHAKGIEFCFQADETLPQVIKADELRLRQVLLNLLSNAVKFTFKGSCTLSVLSRPSSLQMTFLTFMVEDTGVGIASEVQENVFEPFKQTGERLQYSEGSGLGLTISRELVHLMNGKLQLISPVNELQQMGEGQGSRFFFTIEVAVLDKVASTVLKTRMITGYAGSGDEASRKKILIVDDDEINRIVLYETLKPLGFIIEQAESGLDVLSICERFRPDAILMDLLMPGLDGYAATKALREHGDFSDVPVIAVTALSSTGKDLRQHCLQQGFNEFIAKPYVSTDLLDILAGQLHIELQTEEETVVPPPPDVLDDFVHLIESGNITGVAEKAAETLLIESGKYRNFASQIQELADDFKLIEIENLLSTYRNN